MDTNQKTGFIVDCRNLANVLVNLSVDKSDTERQVRDHLYRAVLGYFANLIAYEGVRALLMEDNKGAFVKKVLSSVLMEIGESCKENEERAVAEYADLAHRTIFIADELLREDDHNCFHQLTGAVKE